MNEVWASGALATLAATLFFVLVREWNEIAANTKANGRLRTLASTLAFAPSKYEPAVLTSDSPLTRSLRIIGPQYAHTWTCAIVGVALLMVCAVFIGVFVAVVLALSVFAIGAGIRSSIRDHRAACYEASVPRLLDELARSLRSGAGFQNALNETRSVTSGPIGFDVERVCRDISLGSSTVAALNDWGRRRPVRSVRLCVASLSLALATGARQAQAVDSAAATIRQFLDARSSATAAATESKASAFVLAAMPMVTTGPLLVVNEDARAFMLHSLVGQTLLVAGLILDGIGVVVMNRMIKRTLS